MQRHRLALLGGWLLALALASLGIVAAWRSEIEPPMANLLLWIGSCVPIFVMMFVHRHVLQEWHRTNRPTVWHVHSTAAARALAVFVVFTPVIMFITKDWFPPDSDRRDPSPAVWFLITNLAVGLALAVFTYVSTVRRFRRRFPAPDAPSGQ